MGSKFMSVGCPIRRPSSIERFFAAHGGVASARIITDIHGQSVARFVEWLGFRAQARSRRSWIRNGGRTLTVNEARPQEPRAGGGGGRGGFGGGGGRSGGGGKRDRW